MQIFPFSRQKHISAKLKNFFPSEQLGELNSPIAVQTSQVSARVTNGGFRPSQMLEFTPSDVMHGSTNRFPPSYLEPNYKHQVPSSLANLNPQQSAMDKQFAFPDDDDGQSTYHSFGSTQIPTTPVVSYLDPYTQQNYRYTPTTTPAYIQYQREQPDGQGDQAYTVQSSLLVGNHSPHRQRPGSVDDVYLKRPGYVFDESPSPVYRRPPPPTTTTAAKATSATSASSGHKISYDSHDYPPPSYATQQTSNFVPQSPKQQPIARPTAASYRPPYNNRQDVNDNRPLAGPSIHEAAYASQPQFSSSSSSNYANNFGNYLQRPPPGYPSQSQTQFQSQTYSPTHSQSNPIHYQYEPPQQHQQQHSRPPPTQLIRALENIARNDDLQCVPKVLCQMIAGQTLRGQLPGFITSPAITKWVSLSLL